jgi:uncharacterized protein (DUF3820 family)
MKMPFGKYKGKEIDEIIDNHPSYIVWLHDNCDITGPLGKRVAIAYEDCLEAVIESTPRRGHGIDFLGNEWDEDGYYDPNFGYIPDYDDGD